MARFKHSFESLYEGRYARYGWLTDFVTGERYMEDSRWRFCEGGRIVLAVDYNMDPGRRGVSQAAAFGIKVQLADEHTPYFTPDGEKVPKAWITAHDNAPLLIDVDHNVVLHALGFRGRFLTYPHRDAMPFAAQPIKYKSVDKAKFKEVWAASEELRVTALATHKMDPYGHKRVTLVKADVLKPVAEWAPEALHTFGALGADGQRNLVNEFCTSTIEAPYLLIKEPK